MKTTTPGSHKVWMERYEALRAQALGHKSGQALGMVLFLRHGMTTWMETWERLVPSIHRDPAVIVGQSETLANGSRGSCQNGSSANNLSTDLSIVLANMALRHLEAVP